MVLANHVEYTGNTQFRFGGYGMNEYTEKSGNLLERAADLLADLMQTILQLLYLKVMRTHQGMRKVQSTVSLPDLKKKIFTIFLQRITGGDWNTDPAVLTVRCSILQTDRTVARTADPAVTAANIPSLVMMYSCSMRSTMTDI